MPGLLWVFSPSGSAQAFQAPKPPARAPYIDAAVHRRRHTLMLLSIPEHMTKQGAAREVGEPVVLATD